MSIDRPMPADVGPVATLVGLGLGTDRVLRRMESDYAARDRLSAATVRAMYGLYGAQTAALAWSAIGRVWPVELPVTVRWLGGTLVGTSSVVSIVGMSRFSSPAQLSGTDAGELHVAGIYGWTRNPQYLGLGLAVTGLALGRGSLFSGVLAAGIWAAYRRWIPHEEAHLARVFGVDYERHAARTHRWLGWPHRRL